MRAAPERPPASGARTQPASTHTRRPHATGARTHATGVGSRSTSSEGTLRLWVVDRQPANIARRRRRTGLHSARSPLIGGPGSPYGGWDAMPVLEEAPASLVVASQPTPGVCWPAPRPACEPERAGHRTTMPSAGGASPATSAAMTARVSRGNAARNASRWSASTARLACVSEISRSITSSRASRFFS